MREVDSYGLVQVLQALTGAILGWLIVNLVPVETPTDYWFIFLCGFIAICAMLLPGISGSFILLILGSKYAYIFDAFGQANLVIIAIFGLGAIGGLAAFSRVIGWLLNHYHQSTLLVIKGILIGSLWVIWPFQQREYSLIGDEQKLLGSHPVLPTAIDSTVLASMMWLLAGFILVLVIHRIAVRLKISDPEGGIAMPLD